MGEAPVTPLRISSWNIENFRASEAPERAGRIASAIVNDLKSPHIIAIQEMAGDSDMNPSARQNAEFLIHELSLRDQKHHYAYCDAPPKENEDGGKPGSNIRCGYLYRTDRVAVESEPTRIGVGSEAFKGKRKSSYAVFKDKTTGENYHTINVHFVAPKALAHLAEGEDIEASNKERDAQRIAQATLTAQHVQEILTKTQGNEKEHVIVCGDFNNTDDASLKPFEDIGLFAASSHIDANQFSCFGPDAKGQVRGINIDHMFISAPLKGRIGDMSRSMLYDGKTQDPISDHNPMTLSVTAPTIAQEKAIIPPLP